MNQPGKVAIPARGQLAKQEKWIFPFPRSRLRILSRETGSAVPSRVSSLIPHTETESGEFTSWNSSSIILLRDRSSKPESSAPSSTKDTIARTTCKWLPSSRVENPFRYLGRLLISSTRLPTCVNSRIILFKEKSELFVSSLNALHCCCFCPIKYSGR